MAVPMSNALATAPVEELAVELAAAPPVSSTDSPPAAPSDEPEVIGRYLSMIVPMVPGLMIVLGLIAVFLAALPSWGELRSLEAYRELFLSFTVFAPIVLILGFYLQARKILASAFGSIDRILTAVNNSKPDQLKAKLEALDNGLSLCRYATSKSRPIFLLALSLLAYGVPMTAFTMSPIMGLLFPLPARPDMITAILIFEAPPIALLGGFVLMVWHAYQASRLKEFYKYVVDERAVVIGKMRIMDRFADRYVELSSLTEQVAELIKVNEKLATSDASKNTSLLLLGVILSALISIVGILGGAGLLAVGGIPLDGNVVSAILGVVVAAIITVQNTFRLAERSRFQRGVAGDARQLFTELVYSVDNDEKLQAVLRDYQRLSDRSVRDFPTARELEAPPESSLLQRDSAG